MTKVFLYEYYSLVVRKKQKTIENCDKQQDVKDERHKKGHGDVERRREKTIKKRRKVRCKKEMDKK